MKYTIDEEKKLIIIQTNGTESVKDFIQLKVLALEEFEDFSIKFETVCVTKQELITDSGYITEENIEYVYSKGCWCNRGNAICDCELKNKK
jgi:hypothetical protein